MPFPRSDRPASRSSTPAGGPRSFAAKSKHIDDAKAFLKWLWIDNTADQEDWCLSYGFHIPPAQEPGGEGDQAAERSRGRDGQAERPIRRL